MMRKNDSMQYSDVVEQEVSRRLRQTRERLFVTHLWLFLLFLVANFFYPSRNLFAFLPGAFNLQESPIILYMFVGWCIGLALHGLSVFFARDAYQNWLRRRTATRYSVQRTSKFAQTDNEKLKRDMQYDHNDDNGELVDVDAQFPRMLERQ